MKLTTDAPSVGTRPEDTARIVNGVSRQVPTGRQMSAAEAGVRPEDTAFIVNGVCRTTATRPEVSAAEAGVRPEDTARVSPVFRGTLTGRGPAAESRQTEVDTTLSTEQTARGGAAELSTDQG